MNEIDRRNFNKNSQRFVQLDERIGRFVNGEKLIHVDETFWRWWKVHLDEQTWHTGG